MVHLRMLIAVSHIVFASHTVFAAIAHGTRPNIVGFCGVIVAIAVAKPDFAMVDVRGERRWCLGVAARTVVDFQNLLTPSCLSALSRSCEVTRAKVLSREGS